jgi:hypothetical protein
MNLNKKLVDKDSLLRDVSDIEIYKCYAPSLDLELGKPTLSPLRDESNASFGLFLGESGEIFFNDFLLGGGDCIKFVQLMFGDTFFQAMSRIVIDFKLTDKYYYKEVDTNFNPSKVKIDREALLKSANTSLIRKRKRKWNSHDAEYWLQYGINKSILLEYNVEPVSHIFINKRIISCDNNTYCFIEKKDGKETYKIYQPYNKEYKWLNNHDESVWQGWEQLPEKGDVLIITKSLKDVMTIKAVTGIPAISLQAESVRPKPHIIEELKQRFSTIFIWYDNDYSAETNWGKKFGTALAEEFGLIPIFIPDEYRIKDPSDYYKRRGRDHTAMLIESLTNIPF